MAGPTPWCNWAIPGRVIAGAYPASLDDAETERILVTLLELGMNTFVCLQAEVNINIPESQWRSGNGLRPYIKDAQKILSRAHERRDPKISQQKIDFLHLPIIDGSVTTDSAMSRLADDCIERVLKGERLYIHCWGGHGRTGTLISVMLGRLYNLPYTTAIRYCQAFHDSRMYPQGVRSPQTPVQRAQVRRLLAAQSNAPAPSSSLPTRPVSAAMSPSGSASITSGINAIRPPMSSQAAVSGSARGAVSGTGTNNTSAAAGRTSANTSLGSRASPTVGGRYGTTSAVTSTKPGTSSIDRLSSGFGGLKTPSATAGSGAGRTTSPSAYRR